MILLIDNYDSFSYNLYQLVGSIEPDIKVIRNDAMTVGDIEKMNPDGIIISPGPGRPEDSGGGKKAWKQISDTWCVPWTSGNMHDLRGNGVIR